MTDLVCTKRDVATDAEFTRALAECGDYISRFGLTMSPKTLAALCEKHEEALRDNRRIEFGAGTMKKLVLAFADSPFMDDECYADRLSELIDAFYYFKNESLDLISDDELIDQMRKAFDRYEGDTEAVACISLERLCRMRRFGIELDEEEDVEEEDDEDCKYR